MEIKTPYGEDIAAIDPEDTFRERIRHDLLCKAEGYRKRASSSSARYAKLVEACWTLSDEFPEIRVEPLGFELVGTYLSPAGAMLGSQFVIWLREALAGLGNDVH